MKKNQRDNRSVFKADNAHLLLLIGVLLTTSSAFAAESKEPKSDGFLRSYSVLGLPLLADDENLAIGLGVGFVTNPFKGVDDEILPFPDISYQNGNFSIDLNEIGYAVYSQENCAITLLGSWRSAPYDSDDSTYLHGMEKRDFVVEGGVSLTGETPVGTLGLMAMSDVTNNHKGQIVTAQYSISFGSESWGIEPVAGVSWQSKKMVDYYYGVRQSEVRDDRPAYSGKSTFSPFIGLSGELKISDHVVLQSGVNCEFMGSGITDSPLIDDKYVLSGSVSLSYFF